MKARMLGTAEVSGIGFGTMSFASTYGESGATWAANFVCLNSPVLPIV